NLPANYDLTLYSDIGTAYQQLSGESLQDLGQQFAALTYFPGTYAPGTYAPNAYPSGDGAYASAQELSLVSVSSQDGTTNERITANTWNNTGSFYVRVSGRNGAYDPGQDFHVAVHVNAGSCA